MYQSRGAFWQVIQGYLAHKKLRILAGDRAERDERGGVRALRVPARPLRLRKAGINDDVQGRRSLSGRCVPRLGPRGFQRGGFRGCWEHASERRGITLKGYTNFDLKAKAKRLDCLIRAISARLLSTGTPVNPNPCILHPQS